MTWDGAGRKEKGGRGGKGRRGYSPQTSIPGSATASNRVFGAAVDHNSDAGTFNRV